MLAQERNKWNPSTKKQFKRKYETFSVFKDTFVSKKKTSNHTANPISPTWPHPPVCVTPLLLLKCPFEHVLCHVAAESVHVWIRRVWPHFVVVVALLSLMNPICHKSAYASYHSFWHPGGITLFHCWCFFFFFCSPPLSLLPSQTSVEVVIEGRESRIFSVDCYVMLKELWWWLPFCVRFFILHTQTHTEFCHFWFDFMLTITKLSQFWCGKISLARKKYSVSKHIIYM